MKGASSLLSVRKTSDGATNDGNENPTLTLYASQQITILEASELFFNAIFFSRRANRPDCDAIDRLK